MNDGLSAKERERRERREARHARLRVELEAKRQPFAVLVENLKDDINIGGIMRTAHSALAREFIIVGQREWNRYAAMSADEWENIVELPTAAEAIAHVRSRGWPLVAVEQREGAPYVWDAAYPPDPVFAFGHEIDGVSPELLAAADLVVQLPQWGLVGSLNVAHTAAIVIYDWARKHIEGYPPPHVPVERTKNAGTTSRMSS